MEVSGQADIWRNIYVLEDCNEQVDQKDVGHKQVTSHDSRCEPGPRDTRWKFLPIFIV